jgi:hypothetical protein
MARREFLIAPVLMDVLPYTNATINVEHPVLVNDRLKGSLSKLLSRPHRFERSLRILVGILEA